MRCEVIREEREKFEAWFEANRARFGMDHERHGDPAWASWIERASQARDSKPPSPFSHEHEALVAHAMLDRAGVPRADASGEQFSIWGRIEEYAHQQVQAQVPPGKLSDDEWTSREP